MKKILLISPNIPNQMYPQYKIHNLGLLSIANSTPNKYQVEIFDERLGEKFDFESHIDKEVILVGFQALTANAPIVFELAKKIKRHKIKVVIGGPYVSSIKDMPKLFNEAISIFDSILVGEGDLIWPKMIMDLEKNEIKKVYRQKKQSNLESLGSYKKDPRINQSQNIILHGKKPNAYGLEKGRGCSFKCDFCGANHVFGEGYRERNSNDIVKEINSALDKGWDHFYFVDNEFFRHIPKERNKTKILLEKIKNIPIKRWKTSTSLLALKKDKEEGFPLLKLAKKSGLYSVFVGFETISEGRKGLGKLIKPKTTIRLVREIQNLGIKVCGYFMFGFDWDSPDVFQSTTKFILEADIYKVNLYILTPLPGTKIWNTLNKQGRIFDKNFLNYTCTRCVFIPKQMKPSELVNGVIKCHSKLSKKVRGADQLSIRYYAERVFGKGSLPAKHDIAYN
ncbi:radical SAM protein [Candidatus Pacearchaeota archaeon]|nr:radical SAM protein [Candidatus Pacearchaeota archaeon]